MEPQTDFVRKVSDNQKVGSYLSEHLNMPYTWTNTDTKNALLASIVPVGIGLGASLQTIEGGRYRRHLERSTRPAWANYDAALFSHMDLLTLSPLGYAAYLVYKNGGGFDYTDTTTALGLFGTSMVLTAAFTPLCDKGTYKGMAINSALVAAVGSAMFVAFRKIDERASWFVLPYAIWSCIQAVHHFQLLQLNNRDI